MGSRAVVVVGLGFGDEGKGSIVDYLVRSDETVGTVVRFSGGPQAAHRVVAPDGREHVFSQFGSGTLVPGVRTILAHGMVVNPFNLLKENEHLREIGVRDALDRLTVDSRCLIVTPYQIHANRALERARGDGRHGSCGQGVGEARSDELKDGIALRAGHLCGSRENLLRRLKVIRDLNYAKVECLSRADQGWNAWGSDEVLHRMADAYRDERFTTRVVLGGDVALRRALDSGRVVFEGAQGVLLDQDDGFHPHTTWTSTTAQLAYELLEEADALDGVETVGVIRTYHTRHGAGPFPTEDEMMTRYMVDAENGDGEWQGTFRVGWLDLPLLRYALAVCPVDSVALTHLDRIAAHSEWRACAIYDRVPYVVPPGQGCDPQKHGYENAALLSTVKPVLLPVPPTLDAYAELLWLYCGARVSIASYGPTADEKRLVARAEEVAA